MAQPRKKDRMGPPLTTSSVSSVSTAPTPSSTLYRNGRQRGTLGAEALLRSRLEHRSRTACQSSTTSSLGVPGIHTPAESVATLRSSASETLGSREVTGSTICLNPLQEWKGSHGDRHEVASRTTSVSSVGTSSCAHTRLLQQLRDLREDNERLRTQNNILQREAGRPALTDEEEGRRLSQLTREERTATANAPRRSTAGLFKSVCSIDLLFLIDTTKSMRPYIESAKSQVRSILDDINRFFLNQAEVRAAVVGYKDHEAVPKIEFLDFTRSVKKVRSFLNTLNASAFAGDDFAEDVLGALHQALAATWKHQTRVVLHIADAPPHGRTLHDLSDKRDRYPNPGSEPHGLTYQPILKRMLDTRINYVLLRIKKSTDRMALQFLKEYARAGSDCMLSEKNRYYSEAGGTKNSDGRPNGGLVFREAELGLTFAALQRLVVEAVTTSVMSSTVRSLTPFGSIKRAPGGTSSQRVNYSGLGSTQENEELPVRRPDVRLEKSSPQWGNLEWFDECLVVEGFSIDATVTAALDDGFALGTSMLDRMMESDTNMTVSVFGLNLRKRRTPFAKGALRLASFACTEYSRSRYVVKEFKTDGDNEDDGSHNRSLAHLVEDMRSQALCKAFAVEFNSLLADCPEHNIDFVVTSCFKCNDRRGSKGKCMSIEPFLAGKFVKYNGNAGYANKEANLAHDPSNQAAQAFSHFTFERSRGRFLVCDLQGVGKTMTDPAVHTLDPYRFSLSQTNLGAEGFMFFFAYHECNHLCRRLSLRSSATMFMGDGEKMQFRDSWPSPGLGNRLYGDEAVVCCSNKLCGRILKRFQAVTSKHPSFPGYRWCDECLPQLGDFNVIRLCWPVGEQRHRFEVSGFFYESQGKRIPLRCPKHDK
ncbi:hypothetical protein NEUTE1DRAFT_34830 [Neurospora tetrasperma FGSC 2508]|uniref:Alpha-type protein kinase domain-containing protein n=1 Tax=Neurospora tetrasperma (strain FGSC 2508 / ATCC MYA-4615 / P0657) TaxID=510951 RepID=F8MBR4_NEUT8|nr:uncharacterized protein NEUTE1DRAFT_34830 [Neurospora tetrasperma FGSC 2508]EGO60322.1 hypothetical protein NEUTE1DRAFT_34830 [Neurospora tetrasperma FGSC 2508]EGZ75705.1 hypothetical protein NEUTE2DRAFT_55206 [Neurospora tetrasperma FGSC 2509]